MSFVLVYLIGFIQELKGQFIEQLILRMKAEGQTAVSRIIEIRQYFPKANSLQAKEDYVRQFKEAILKLVSYLKTEPNQKIVAQLKGKLPGLQEELRKMKAETEQIKKKSPPSNLAEEKKPSSTSTSKKPIDKDQDEIAQGLEGAIVKEKPNVSWEDVGGLQQAKKVLQEAVILPIKFPEVFVGERTPWKGILLYGPPGTGKTFLAKACATEMQGGTFFSVSSSDLMSKYVGQAEKTLRHLFEMARKEKPSIIFIDEIDSIAGERSAEENEVSRRVKTQFLVQMQGVGNDCKDVLVLGATNLPWAIDSAVRRRFQKRVYIPLPDIRGRLAMIKKVIEKNKIKMTAEEINDIAKRTQGYSGSDISNMANDALMGPVRILNETKVWVEVNDEGQLKYAPVEASTPKDPNCRYFQGTMDQVKQTGRKLYLSTKYSDFVKALKNSKASVSQQDLHKYIEWTKTFGVDG